MALSVNRLVKSPGVVVLTVGGTLDANTSPELEFEVSAVLSGSVRALIFDFEFLDFISSAGIRLVMMAQKEMKKRGASIVLMNLQPQIQKVFDIVKALPDAAVFSSLEELDAYLAQMQAKFRK